MSSTTCGGPTASGWYASARPYYSYEKNAWLSPYVAPKNSMERTYDLQFWVGPDRGSVYYRRWNAERNDWEILYTGRKGAGAMGGDKLCVKSGTTLTVLNAAIQDPRDRVKQFTVPYADSKSESITRDGQWFTYFGPWGTYQRILVNTDTGEIRKGCQFTWTHGMSGYPYSLMSYGESAKLVVPQETMLGNAKPGRNLALYGPYADQVITDYGIMTDDCRFGVTNGIGGELDAQHVMFDRTDPGSILRVCTYHVSKINWRIWTKSIPSPDYTKLVFISDMLGQGDYYLAVMRLPDAPRELKAVQKGQSVRLQWLPGLRSREIKGYNVYRSTRSGRNFARINQELVRGNSYLDSQAPTDGAYYLVAALEHSGLEGIFSDEAAVGGRGPLCLHFEAEEQARRLPMRDVIDGTASGYHACRVTRVAPGESAGCLFFAVHAPREGRYLGVGPCPRLERVQGLMKIEPGEATLTVDSARWTWVKGSARVPLRTGEGLTLSSDVDGLGVDKLIVTDDDLFQPQGMDDRTAPPPPVQGLKVAEATNNSIALTWEASQQPDLYHYSVYVGTTPNFALGNESILSSGMKNSAFDWGIKSGARFFYKVVAVDRRGKMSEPAAISARTRAMDVFSIELPAVKARLGAGLKREKDLDVAYVGGRGSLTFEFEVPARGIYYLWAEYGARKAKGCTMPLFLDGQSLGTWESREPFRMSRDLPAKAGKVRWFVDRITTNNRKSPQAIEMRQGQHLLTISLQEVSPWISKLWVTNDPSLVPPGFMPGAFQCASASKGPSDDGLQGPIGLTTPAGRPARS